MSVNILDTSYQWNHAVFIFLWLTLLLIMPTRSVYVVIKVKIFFLFFLGWIISVFVYSIFYLSSQDFPHSSVGKESVCNAGRPRFDPWVGKIRWRRDRLPTLVFLGFPCGSAGKESASSVGDLGSTPGLGRFLGEGKGYPLQCSGLENSMDCIVYGIAKSWTWPSDLKINLSNHLLMGI